MPEQGTLDRFGGGGENEGCPHDEDYTREYVLPGKHFDGYRERRVYCRGCNTVIERERLSLEVA